MAWLDVGRWFSAGFAKLWIIIMNVRVLIVAGGTGGHIYPGLAVAEKLREEGSFVAWLGAYYGLESEIIPQHDIPLHLIRVKGLRGRGLVNTLLAPFQLIKAFFHAFNIISQVKPHVVLAMGGYVCGPVGIAAWCRRVPLILHEQNAVPGLTNKVLAYFAKKVLLGFDVGWAKRESCQDKFQVVGNPVRQSILDLSFSNTLNHPLNLLIFGGSQGALSFNNVVPVALSSLPQHTFKIWHQAGKQHLETAKKNYEKIGITAKITAFIDDMTQAYQWADIIICRAGALTIAELAAAGKAAIIIPYPYAVDDHQTENAKYLTKNNAAILLVHEQFTPKKLASLLKNLIENPINIQKLAEKAHNLRKITATESVVSSLF